MFSGKSEELIRRMIRADLAGQRTLLVKPRLDDRYSVDEVVSHAGRRLPCLVIHDIEDVRGPALDHPVDVVGIEEAQFFGSRLPGVIDELIAAGRRVICAGLDMDAFERPFHPMPEIMACAEQVTKLTAVCVRCGEDATRSQLLIEGSPAPQPYGDGEFISVGGSEAYEARCRACHQIA